MMRFAWVTMASAVLLAGCGGGLSSPDFKGDLVGFDIVYPNSNTVGAKARAVPGSTFQFSAIGLYSLPPGTAASSTNRSCPSASDTSRVCRVGEISNVNWSIDPAGTVNGQPLATINADGLVTAVRRGYVPVRARVSGFPDATEELIVNGPVVSAISVRVLETKYNREFSGSDRRIVPTGRSFTLVGTASCERGFATARPGEGDEPVAASPGNCINGANASYQFGWTVGDTTDPAVVDFSPATGASKSVLVKTKRFGPFEVLSRLTNEEGQEVRQSVSLEAGPRVLEDIVVFTAPEQTRPFSVIIGAKTQFVAKGLFSDGATDDIRSTDLRGALTWVKDPTAVGDIAIEQSVDSPNAVVLVSGRTVGGTGVTVSGRNIENGAPGQTNEGGLELQDRAPINVVTLGLVKLADICPATAAGTDCPQSIQIPVGQTITFKARGIFTDNPNVSRDIDPAVLPLTWSQKNTTGGTVTPVVANGVTTGAFRGTTIGLVTLGVELTNPGSEPQVTGVNRQATAPAVVVEAQCRDQLLSPDATSAMANTDAPTGFSRVENAGSVIDSSPATRGTFTLGPSLIGGNRLVSMSFNRPAISITTTAAREVGFVVAYRSADDAPVGAITLLNATGADVPGGQNNSPTVVGPVVRADLGAPGDGFSFYTIKTSVAAGVTFTGARLAFNVPSSLSDPLNTSASGVQVHVYTACADIVQ